MTEHDDAEAPRHAPAREPGAAEPRPVREPGPQAPDDEAPSLDRIQPGEGEGESPGQ